VKPESAGSHSRGEFMRGTLQLLNREPPEDYRRELTERIANRKPEQTPGSHSVVVFRIGPEWLALPTRVFQEVAGDCVVHAVPHRRNEVLIGLINLRGELLVCVSLGALLGLAQETSGQSANAKSGKTRILVASLHGNRLAIPVDEVGNVVRFAEGDLRAMPATLSHGGVPFTIGLLPWEGKMAGCLDEARLFRELEQSFL
jgi:chemotaxis-related protein WspD